jgi:hypothetical protein
VFDSGLGFSESLGLPTDGDPIHVDLVLDGYKIGIASVTSTREDRGLRPIPEGQRAAVILWTHDTEQAYTSSPRMVSMGSNRSTSGLAGC